MTSKRPAKLRWLPSEWLSTDGRFLIQRHSLTEYRLVDWQKEQMRRQQIFPTKAAAQAEAERRVSTRKRAAK